MTKSITTSIRLNPDLRNKLEHASKVMHRGKSWIINHALQKYLSEIEMLSIAKEAKRQSLLARESDEKNDDSWDDLQDTTGWE